MEELTPHFTAWRLMPAGSREIIDAIVTPASRGSASLSEALNRWPGKWYWLDQSLGHLVLVRPVSTTHPRWLVHGVLIALTILCTLGAGAILAGSYEPPVRPGFWGTFIAAWEFFVQAVQRDWLVLLQGWSFGLPLLAILLIHELGHYLTARRYGIDTTAPFFIPIPPTISPIGSLGAFIRVRSPLVDRRQLLDVGAAGPLAGFVVALAVLIWGYTTSERIPIVLGSAPSYVTLSGTPLFLGESLLTRFLRDWLVPGTEAVHLSLPAFAGWVGMFVTGLNLIPLSQLDGGRPLALWESGAILIYLADKSGRLLPADPIKRLETIQWVFWQMAGVGPMFGQVGYFHKFAGREIADKRPLDRYVAEARRLLGVLDRRLEGRDWIMDDYSIADIATLGWVRNLIGFYEARELVVFDDFAKVAAWLERGLARPAVQRGLTITAKPE